MNPTRIGEKSMKILHSVFVGGSEVNDNLLTLEQADELALEYLEKGYNAEEIFIAYIKVD